MRGIKMPQQDFALKTQGGGGGGGGAYARGGVYLRDTMVHTHAPRNAITLVWGLPRLSPTK